MQYVVFAKLSSVLAVLPPRGYLWSFRMAEALKAAAHYRTNVKVAALQDPNARQKQLRFGDSQYV